MGKQAAMRFYLVVTTLFALTGCDEPATKIGTPCKADGECNVEGQRCVRGICTKPCTRTIAPAGEGGGCPAGYDCTIGDAEVGLTCNAVKYAFDPMTGTPLLFGKACAGNDAACNETGDPNPMPMCRKIENPAAGKQGTPFEEDPAAYCTGRCESDEDCPYDMACGEDYDKVKKCLKRQQCSECVTNDQCPGGACIATQDGMAKYCTKPCNTDLECPGSAQLARYMLCQDGTDAAGTTRRFCVHQAGACTGTGELCQPCRAHSDCMEGLRCVTIDSTGERWCSKACTAAGGCGDLSTCYVPPQSTSGLCVGTDPGQLTCHPYT